MRRVIRTIVIHHSATASGSVEQFDREHRARGFREIGYHAVIGNGRGQGDGLISEGRRDEEVGAAVYGANTGKLQVCLVGNFHFASDGYTGSPTRAQLDALGHWLLSKSWAYAGRFARPPLEVAGHREVSLKTHPTACPGSDFPINAVRRWFEHFAAKWSPGATPPISLGEFVARGGGPGLIDDLKCPVKPSPSRGVRVLRADGEEVEVPVADWKLVDGQTYIRLRALAHAMGRTVDTDDRGVLLRAHT